MIMKKGLFKGSGESDVSICDNNEKLRKRVHKIMTTKEYKRNFMPLFDCRKPQILNEEERKDFLMQVARKYFETKGNIIEKENVI